ncbi:MAG: leucyl aminopeptidase family protein [Clostridiales bacterium]|nr:leucyl aminopeptidase family protein [Clostridiales bacterium]
MIGVVAACENMVDATSYRNGDVIYSMSGKTKNTMGGSDGANETI